MANCDIQSGRLREDCSQERAGVKTVFFFKHNLLNVSKNLAGQINGIGAGFIYRFEQDSGNGLAVQEITRGDGDTQYLNQQIDLTIFYITPEFLQTINYLKKGNWAIFFMDYEDKIRLLGEFTPMTQNGGLDQTGVAAGDNLYSNLSFMGITSAYAPFLEDFTDHPFDNFPLVEVLPRYDNLPGLLLANNANDKIKADIYGNRLDWN